LWHGIGERPINWAGKDAHPTKKVGYFLIWKLLSTVVGHNKAVWSVAFNPQGHTLASGSADETIKIWQVPSKQL